MLGRGWQYQWERVGRRLADVRAVYSGRAGGTEPAVDDVQSFFEAVRHLRDWLNNDPTSPLSDADTKPFVKGSTSLSLCGDLANGSKHFVLTGAWTGDLSTTIARNDVAVLIGTGTSKHRFYVASGGAEYDVLQLAEDAVKEWATFLRGHGLMS